MKALSLQHSIQFSNLRYSFNSRYLASAYPLHWYIEFSLIDKTGNVIDTCKTEMRRAAPLGKGSDSGSKAFTISENAIKIWLALA
jgi:hypothetical protein